MPIMGIINKTGGGERVLILENILTLLREPVFWLVILFIFWQYSRNLRIEKQLLGCKINSPWEQVIISTFYGIIGGFLGSLILVSLQVNLNNLGISYLWFLALGLMLIHPRFLCLAYSGGILGLLYLLGLVADLNLTALMLLIGILHLIESFLVYLSGYQGASPVFVKLGQDKLAGAFNLFKIWPIPLVALSSPGDFSCIPIIAALGYQDLALANSPKQRSFLSARNLMFYSLLLIFFTYLSGSHSGWQLVTVLFAPLGHELVIWKGKQEEWQEKPGYLPPLEGVMVLETLPNSLAQKMGLERGDTIIKANGQLIHNKRDLTLILSNSLPWLDLEIRKNKGERKRKKSCSSTSRLGVVLVPDPQASGPYVEIVRRKFGLWQ